MAQKVKDSQQSQLDSAEIQSMRIICGIRTVGHLLKNVRVILPISNHVGGQERAIE